MGRTGRLFAREAAGIIPDIMAIAKAIGGGFPLGACLATEAVAKAMPAGRMARPMAAIRWRWRSACRARRHPGRGLPRQRPTLIAQAAPASGAAARCLSQPDRGDPRRGSDDRAQMHHSQSRCGAGGDAGEVLDDSGRRQYVRLLPPLVLTDDEMSEGVERLDRALGRLADAAAPKAIPAK